MCFPSVSSFPSRFTSQFPKKWRQCSGINLLETRKCHFYTSLADTKRSALFDLIHKNPNKNKSFTSKPRICCQVSLHSKNALASAKFRCFHVALHKINSFLLFIQIYELQLKIKREKSRRASMTCHASSPSSSFSRYFHRRPQNFRASKIILANSNLFSMFLFLVGWRGKKLFCLKMAKVNRTEKEEKEKSWLLKCSFEKRSRAKHVKPIELLPMKIPKWNQETHFLLISKLNKQIHWIRFSLKAPRNSFQICRLKRNRKVQTRRSLFQESVESFSVVAQLNTKQLEENPQAANTCWQLYFGEI